MGRLYLYNSHLFSKLRFTSHGLCGLLKWSIVYFSCICRNWCDFRSSIEWSDNGIKRCYSWIIRLHFFYIFLESASSQSSKEFSIQCHRYNGNFKLLCWLRGWRLRLFDNYRFKCCQLVLKWPPFSRHYRCLFDHQLQGISCCWKSNCRITKLWCRSLQLWLGCFLSKPSDWIYRLKRRDVSSYWCIGLEFIRLHHQFLYNW